MILSPYCRSIVSSSCSRLPLGLRRRDDNAGLEVIRPLTRASSVIPRRSVQIIIDIMETFATDAAKYWLAAIDGITAAAPNDGTIVSRRMWVEYAHTARNLLSQMVRMVALGVATIGSPPGWWEEPIVV